MRLLLLLLILFPFLLFGQDSLKEHIQSTNTAFYNKGNNDNFYISTNNLNTLAYKRFYNSTVYNYVYGQQYHVINQNEQYFSNTLFFKLRKKLNAITTIQLESSYLRGFNLRYAYGAGLGLRLNSNFYITDLLISDNTFYINKEHIRYVVNSFRIRYNYTKNKTLIILETYLQPDIQLKYSKYKLNFSFNYQLLRILLLTISITDSYEQYIINNKVNNDLNITFGFTIKI